jgi:DNA-binding response OmpR family regulator
MSKKILIAEDQPDSRRLLEDLLTIFQPYDVRVYVARDGVEAYDTACRERPDVILLDIMMPGMNGFDLCKKLKSDPDLACTYVIMLSGKTQHEDRTEAALCGADEYVTKPYDVALILERVQNVLKVNPL